MLQENREHLLFCSEVLSLHRLPLCRAGSASDIFKALSMLTQCKLHMDVGVRCKEGVGHQPPYDQNSCNALHLSSI